MSTITLMQIVLVTIIATVIFFGLAIGTGHLTKMLWNKMKKRKET